MELLIKILQFIVSLSLLVIVHELGHFMFARLFGVRVERFSLFFGKPLVSVRRGDTEYCIGGFPFGGYVKMSGMIDESMDTKHVGEEPKPYEFRSKTVWQRLLIMLGGVMMNVVFAFLIYTFMIFVWGDSYLSTKDVKYGYVFHEQMHELGFEDGDRIISVNGKEYEDISDLSMSLIVEPDTPIVAKRGDSLVTLTIPASKVLTLGNTLGLFVPRYPFVLLNVIEGGGAQAAGLEPGDRLVALNGEPMEFFDGYVKSLSGHKSETVTLTVIRGGESKDFDVAVSEYGTIGASLDAEYLTPVRTREYTFLQSFPAGVSRVGAEIGGYWKQLKLLVKPDVGGMDALGGPLAIGSIFPGQWKWYYFWKITAFLSVVLAIMNLLPIPGLDGGHVVFLLYEGITRRKPGTRFLINAQMVGMAILFGIMILATWNDIVRFFF